MVWSEETIRHLRELWEQGHSTAEIGRRLGVSKNAIVGKAHRLDLTARPSPIRRDGPARSAEMAQPACRAVGPTLPPLASAIAPQFEVTNIQPLRRMTTPSTTVQRPATAVAPAVVPPPRIAAAAPPVRSVTAGSSIGNRRSAPSCCWPIGEPGKKDFRFCDDVSLPGKPYCDEHAKLAYVKIRDRKEDAA